MKTRRFCPQCGRLLLKSRIKGYAFQCCTCAEDFYKFEALRKKDLKKVKQLQKENHIPIYNKWWYSTEFKVMETITGYRQSDFDPEDGCQAFADACDKWWESLPEREKIEIRKEYK